MTYVIGFSGTQDGMTDSQFASLEKLVEAVVSSHYGTEVTAMHGDCIGSDGQFDVICKRYHITTFVRPCNIANKRAYCKAIQLEGPLPPLERNQDIVNDSSIMFATPKENKEILRSGTWSTIRRMRKANKPIYIIYPNGKVEK